MLQSRAIPADHIISIDLQHCITLLIEDGASAGVYIKQRYRARGVRTRYSRPHVMFFLLELAAITVFLIVCWHNMCKRRRQFAAVHSVVAAVQETSTGEPAALVIGTRRPLHAAERVDRGRMQVPVPEINHGAASVLAL